MTGRRPRRTISLNGPECESLITLLATTIGGDPECEDWTERQHGHFGRILAYLHRAEPEPSWHLE